MWATYIVCPFFVHLLLLCTWVLLRVLSRPLRAPCTPLGRLLFCPALGVQDQFLRPLGEIGGSWRQESVAPATRHRYSKPRSKVPSFGLCGRLLVLLSQPQCLWAMPTAWGEAVDIIITAARIFPEPLPDPSRRSESLPESPSPSSALIRPYFGLSNISGLSWIGRCSTTQTSLLRSQVLRNSLLLPGKRLLRGFGF